MGEDGVRRAQERENLRHIIQQWNNNRLDLFEISEPNEDLEFHGVMRFYFRDSGQKVATKCIRVPSGANSKHVIETLVEKFRPDMRMLSVPEYALFEIHENGAEERRLGEDEKPLLVQLNWNKDDREGRFLLRNIKEHHSNTLPTAAAPPPLPTKDQPFQRKLSKREKKEIKKAEKIRRAHEGNNGDNTVAEKLYTELPETSFTRSISNPEAVMRRRRAQKLEKKLQQFRSKDGGPDTGGTLKIYGESLRPDVPYKTLLLSIRDNASNVVREMLDKYGLYREDPSNYCLIQNVIGVDEGYGGSMSPHKEYILDDDECPLAILMNHPPSRGSIMFHVRRRPADYGPRKRKKKPVKVGEDLQRSRDPHGFLPDKLPFLVEIGPDGSELGGSGRQHQLHLNVTEVGTDHSTHTGGQNLQLYGPNLQPRHCVVAHTEGIVTVTPCSRDAETYVNGQRIYETTILQHGCLVRFGRIHNFRFIDPQQDDRMRATHIMDSRNIRRHYPSHPTPGSQVGGSNYERYPAPARDPILPAVLEFREESEDAFLHTVITDLDPTDLQFKLAPTYTLYMAARFRASTHYRPDLTPTERAHRLTIMLTKVAAMVQTVLQSRYGDPTSLAFWMANASELLHFLKQDRHVCGYSLDAQDILAEAVQVAFRSLVEYMQAELSTAMPLFLEDRDDINEEEGSSAHVLSILANTMALLRRCRVNAALTIQLFSQLFHFINMWVFNRVVTQHHPNYCTRQWGIRIECRLARIELWAEKQGLELAADCHLARLSQAAMLLHSQKSSPDDIATISSTCFKLNSLQLRALLEMYQPAADEPRIPQELLDNVVAVAESTADGLAREDGREVRLEEEMDLQLPFLLPEDGYSCDIVRGVPSGLAEVLSPLQQAGLCRMNPQPTSSGYWTIYMHDQDQQRIPPGPRSPSVMSNRSMSASMSIPRGEPEVQAIQLHKSNTGMGLSIVATRGVNQDKLGIYIKSVVPGGAADADGRLQAGDQLLSVDGKSLLGITQEQAAAYMMETGPVVTLEVARQGAIFHGLATLLSQPSPQVNRASLRRPVAPATQQQQRIEEASSGGSRMAGTSIPNSHSVPNMGHSGYNERLVDWNQPPRHHPIPPNSSHSSVMLPNSRSSPNLAAAAAARATLEGYPGGGRHMSERDLPSKVLRDPHHPDQTPPHPHHPHQQGPRIQSAKSVPSLNSEGERVGKTGHEVVFNPAYSRTSSNQSLAQNSGQHQHHPGQQHPQPHQHNHLQQRSRSTQNLSESRTVGEEERHYQNVSFHQGQQDPRMASMRGRPHNAPPPLGSPASQGSDGPIHRPPEHLRPASAFLQREDVVRPGDLQRPASQRDLRADAKMAEMQEEVRRREDRFRPNNGPISPAQMQQQRGGSLPHQQQRGPGGYPTSPYGPPQEGFSPQQHQYPPGYQGQPGPQVTSPHGQPQHQPMFGHGPQQTAATHPGHAGKHAPPPTAPKPRPGSTNAAPIEAPEKPLRHYGQDGIPSDGGPPRPPPPEDGYRESPPPPPPPTSTHPLFQPNNRPASSSGFANTPNAPGKGNFSKSSPWDREEKEKNEVRRREGVRQWRDELITGLENLEIRTPEQNERLVTLRLERDFQLRAESSLRNKGDDDDDDDEDDDEDDEDEDHEDNHEFRDQSTLEYNRTNLEQPKVNGGGPVDERSRKEDEIRRKQQELEAASEAEERLLREAQRRQEEEMRRYQQQQQLQQQQQHLQQQHLQQQQLHHQQQQQQLHQQQQQQQQQQQSGYQHQHQASQRLDSLVLSSPGSGGQQSSHSNGPVNGSVRSPQGSYSSSETVMKVDTGQPSPQPPERGSSYNIMQQTGSNRNHKSSPESSAPIKRVQFSEAATVDPLSHITFDTNANHEKAPREDPDHFLIEAENMLNSSPTRSSGGTPGVIGAQEIYRDPRWRRMQEQQAVQAAAKAPVPEKLTFKEKMKMFAMETGEQDQPKDRVKNSRADRDIQQ